jgi:hypothetical protein
MIPAGRPFKLAAVVALTLLISALILAHVTHVNGPWYWTWSWRRLTIWIYPAMALAATPFALAQILWARGRRRRSALACLVASTLLLMLTAIALQPPTGLRRIPLIVQNAAVTGYYTDAAILNDQPNISTWEWLYQYPQVVPLLHHHARYKPPGLMLYYLALVQVFGKGATAALLGGLGIAIAGSLAPLATYGMLRRFTAADDAPDAATDDAAFAAASYLSLCPSLLLFLPMFDLTYVTIAATLLLLYARVVFNPSWRSACLFGVGMALATFLSYIFLILGFFFVVYWLTLLMDRGAAPALGAARALLFSASVCIGLYVLFFVISGFDPIATFRVISQIHDEALVDLARPFPQYLFYDVLDFILGSGYLSVLMVSYWIFARGRDAIRSHERGDRFVQVGLLQILIVAGAGLLPGEAARLWMLLLPLLMTPIGLELAGWTPRRRYILYACLWLLTVVICQNMTFVYMGAKLDGPR